MAVSTPPALRIVWKKRARMWTAPSARKASAPASKCVSAGSACAKGHRSHTLEAMNVRPEMMDGSFRVSICRDTTETELDKLVEVIEKQIIPRFCK